MSFGNDNGPFIQTAVLTRATILWQGRLPTQAGRFVKRQFPAKLAPEEQEIDAGLKEDAGNRQVPDMSDLKPRHAR